MPLFTRSLGNKTYLNFLLMSYKSRIPSDLNSFPIFPSLGLKRFVTFSPLIPWIGYPKFWIWLRAICKIFKACLPTSDVRILWTLEEILIDLKTMDVENLKSRYVMQLWLGLVLFQISYGKQIRVETKYESKCFMLSKWLIEKTDSVERKYKSIVVYLILILWMTE